MKRERRQYRGRKMHTMQCVRTVLRRIRGGIKAQKNKAKKAASKAMREKAEEAPAEIKITQIGCLGW